MLKIKKSTLAILALVGFFISSFSLHVILHTRSTITSITENKFVNALLKKNNYAGVLKSNLTKIDWDLEDIIKSNKRADIILAFNYDDKLEGTIEITMIREDGTWKISGVDFPKFDKINF